MDWLNLHTSILDSPECLRCDPVRRATWIWLLRHCIGQENGGVILGCRSWGDTTWQQLCRVRLREVNMDSPLWEWEGDHLRIAFYPAEKQAEVQAKRESGRLGGRPKSKPSGIHMVNHQETMRVESAETEGKGREGNGIGREGKADPEPTYPPQGEGIFDPQAMAQAKAIMAADAMPKPPLPVPPRSFTDFRAIHGRCFIGKDERPDWEALYRAWGWDAMHDMHEELTDSRIYLNVATQWLAKNYRQEA